MADLSQSFGSILGTQQQQPDIAQKTSEGVQAGVQLATMQDQVEKSKVTLEQQKTELTDKQFMSATSMLGNLARANPVIAKKMLPQIQQRFQQMGWDPSIPEVIASDENYARNYINVAKGFAPNATDEDKAATLQSMQELGQFDKGLTELSQSSKLGNQLEIANKKNEMQAQLLGMRQGNQDNRNQLTASSQYNHEMHDVETGLASASRALGLIKDIDEGKLKSTKGLSGDIAAQLNRLISGGAPTVYGQSSQELNSAYAHVVDYANWIKGGAESRVPHPQLEQVKKDIEALQGMYADQHETKYSGLREGLPDNVRDKLDSRYNVTRKRYGLAPLDENGNVPASGRNQPPPPKFDEQGFRAAAKAAGHSDAEIEATVSKIKGGK